MGKMIAAILNLMEFQLAQLNIARLLHPLDHPAIAPFVNQLDQVKATGLAHPRSTGPFDIVKLSVWESPVALKA